MKNRSFSRRQFIGVSASLAGATRVQASRKSIPQGGAQIIQNPDALAFLGGTPVRSGPFPSWPTLAKVDEDHVLDSLRQRNWCRLSGDITTTFEEKWASLLGAKHVTAVVNGTNALYAALNALDVGPGDEVLLSSYTFVATVNAVIQQYALPIFVDSNRRTFQMDTSKLEGLVTDRTRCILPVHLGGSVADMDSVKRVAQKHGLGVVEDACQAHFAEWRGTRVGGVGDIGCFSFQASKILPCGEGGAIVTNREELLNRFHAFQNNGRDRLTGTRDGYLHQGSNLRMTEFQAALLLAQLTRFEDLCRLRESNAAVLTQMLGEIPGISPAELHEGCTRNTYYIFMFSYNPEAFKGLPRDRFLAAVRKEGIPCGAGYRPLNREPFIKQILESRAYRRIYSQKRLATYFERNHLPENEKLCQEGVFLGQECLLGTKEDVAQVAEAIQKVQRNAELLLRS